MGKKKRKKLLLPYVQAHNKYTCNYSVIMHVGSTFEYEDTINSCENCSKFLISNIIKLSLSLLPIEIPHCV